MHKTFKRVTLEEAREILKEICPKPVVCEKYYEYGNLRLFFTEEPDDDYQNYFAQLGAAALVVNIDATEA